MSFLKNQPFYFQSKTWKKKGNNNFLKIPTYRSPQFNKKNFMYIIYGIKFFHQGLFLL